MATTTKHAIGVGRLRPSTASKKRLPEETPDDKYYAPHYAHAQVIRLDSTIQMPAPPSPQQQLNQCFLLYALSSTTRYGQNTPQQCYIANQFHVVSTKS